MRSLIDEEIKKTNQAPARTDAFEIPVPNCRNDYEQNCAHLRQQYHKGCLFNCRSSLVPENRFTFDHTGVLHSEFTCNTMHQGYDGMAHGGILSAIIDASMAQCLMGHGVVGYTTDLSIKYRKPVLIDKPVALTTSITDIGIGCLYCLKSEIIQGRNLVAQATGRFYKINQPS